MKNDLANLAYVHGWGAVYDALLEMLPKEAELPLALPDSPSERPCWECRRWIRVGTEAVAFPDGKTYHLKCHEQRESA